MGVSSLEEILTRYVEIITHTVNRPGDRAIPAEFSPVEIHTSEPSTGDGSSHEGSEQEEDSITAIIRGLLSRFSGFPENLIHGATSLASMGVDSITAIQISSLARKQGIFIPPATIIQSMNFRELVARIRAEHVEESSGTESTATDMEIQSPLAEVIRTTMPRHLRQYIEAIYPVSPGMEWMIGAWQNSGGCRYQHAFVQRVRGRVDIGRLERSWDALLRFHPILRSTFCPVPALKDNSDHLLALCVLDTLPGNTKRLTRRKLPRLGSEEQALAIEARMSVRHPAASPGVHARLTVLEGGRDTYLLLNFHHFQYGERPLSRLPDDELTPFPQMLGVFRSSPDIWKRSTSESISAARRTSTLTSGHYCRHHPRGGFKRNIGARSSPRAGNQASSATRNPPEGRLEPITSSAVSYPHYENCKKWLGSPT